MRASGSNFVTCSKNQLIPMDNDLLTALKAEFATNEKRQHASDFKLWCASLDSTPSDTKLVLKFVCDSLWMISLLKIYRMP